jgi:DNA repair protein RecN (Recombination protein N)
LDGLARQDPVLGALAERLRGAEYQLADVAEELGSYLDRLDADPASLESLHGRRAQLRVLLRKYGPTLEDVASWASEAARHLAELDGSDQRTGELGAQLELALEKMKVWSGRVSAGRLNAAAGLTEAVNAELTGLAMPGAQVSVDVSSVEAGPHGVDEVAFLLTAHPGAPARPLGRAASGGELSRVMLAIEVVLAAAQGSPDQTLVFDEVDAGIGGRAAVEVGRRLARVAAQTQVVVVTHLAGVAAFADRHIVLDKASDSGADSVATRVAEVVGPDRERELARMLAGHEDSASAREHAKELLALSEKDLE